MNRPVLRAATFLLALTAYLTLVSAPRADQALAPPIVKGQRVFSAGHSFHMFMPPILQEIAQSAGIKDHVQLGKQGIGGSRTSQHWDRPDEQNLAKQALRSGKVDVLTLAPRDLPDEAIDKFV